MRKYFVVSALFAAIFLIGMLSVDFSTSTVATKGKPVKDKPPVVTIVNPADGSTVSGTVTIEVTVVDPEGVYTLVPDIYVDGVLEVTAYTFDWDTTGYADGDHEIYAYAEQPSTKKPGNGNGGGKPPKPIFGEDTNVATVDNSGGGGTGDDYFYGTVSSSNPDSWHYFDAGLGTINAELSWPSGPDVDMYLYRPSDYSNWVTRAYSLANPETMTYEADEDGLWGIRVNMYSSSAPNTDYTLHVTYTPNTPDVTPPTCDITSPTNGEIVYRTTYVKVTATDDRQVDYVDFFVDGVKEYTDISAPFTFPWDTTAWSDGSHTLDATAYDRAGNFDQATQISVTVDQSAAPPTDVQKYAVIVGISDYKAISDLSYCDEDASDWFNYLVNVMLYPADHIQVFGDGHPSDYPQYDGVATEANVKAALNDMVTLADEDDEILFLTSGHGSGDGTGDSFLCMWDCNSGESGEDGSMYDTELADILSASVADKIFVFIDHCYAGGFGPDLMALGNAAHIYCTTTCSDNGYGYDDPGSQNGAWTHEFLEVALIGTFGSDPLTTMEDAFADAAASYPHGGGDAPEEYDGDSGTPFTL
jgi:hypothetical protein